jgi:nitrate ABC transporter ATP-binding subunit
MSSYVEFFEVKKVYPAPGGRSEVIVVDNFNLRMKQGEVVALLGHSGCGKSTVLTMVAGLNPISGGGIIVAGKEVTAPGPDRAVVFQAPCLLPWQDALGNVMLGVEERFPKWSSKERLDHAHHVLDLVGLGGSHHKYPRELSSGMQQRVGIARALALKPKMLLLDEPFGMLDSLTRMELQEVLLKLVESEKMTALMVTHDVDEALFVADRVVMMTTGPNAKVGAIIELPFARPRVRSEVLEHPEYYAYREELIAFLEAQEPEGARKKREAVDAHEKDDGVPSKPSRPDVAA